MTDPTADARGPDSEPTPPSRRGVAGHVHALTRRLRGGELGSVPVIVFLVVIWTTFQILDGGFLAPRNLSNLSVDIVGMGMITIGVVFVLLVGDIDLSVGSVSGLAAAAFAVLHVNHGVPDVLAVVLALAGGAATGLVHGFFVARVGVPSFVVTLAGLLGWNGLMLYLLGDAGSVTLDDDGLVHLLNSSHLPGWCAYVLAAAGSGAHLLLGYRQARRRAAAGVPAPPAGELVLRSGVVAVLAFAAAWALAAFEGLPLALLGFLTLVVGLDVVLRRTPWGRRVFALGGGVEAARRAGINVRRVRASVFVVSGTMAAAGGVFLASRLTSVSQASGSGDMLMNVIAAAVIGGTSLFGGRGSTWSALLGVLVVQSVASGMALLGVQAAVKFMITGGILLVAVVVDTLSRQRQKAHGRA